MNKVAYIVVHPPAKVLATVLKNDVATDIAKSKKALVYQADTYEKDGFTYAMQPWKLKENYINHQSKPVKQDKITPQVPQIQTAPVLDQEPAQSLIEESTKDITCPICNKKFKKQFGLTNHMNAIHPGAGGK